MKTWPDADTAAGKRERDLLQVRSRDVLEHIECVVHHVRRLEQSVKTAVQMQFRVDGDGRANADRGVLAQAVSGAVGAVTGVTLSWQF